MKYVVKVHFKINKTVNTGLLQLKKYNTEKMFAFKNKK